MIKHLKVITTMTLALASAVCWAQVDNKSSANTNMHWVSIASFPNPHNAPKDRLLNNQCADFVACMETNRVRVMYGGSKGWGFYVSSENEQAASSVIRMVVDKTPERWNKLKINTQHGAPPNTHSPSAQGVGGR